MEILYILVIVLVNCQT